MKERQKRTLANCKNKMRGLAALEFTLVSFAFFIVFFACIEVGRLMLIVNNMAQMTRVAARLAAVCPPQDPDIFDLAASKAALTGLISSEALVISYLAADLTPVTDPADNINAIQYVRSAIENYSFNSVIRLFTFGQSLPEQVTILPSESLGVIPGGGNYDC